jgi:hypothetical protein
VEHIQFELLDNLVDPAEVGGAHQLLAEQELLDKEMLEAAAIQMVITIQKLPAVEVELAAQELTDLVAQLVAVAAAALV